MLSPFIAVGHGCKEMSDVGTSIETCELKLLRGRRGSYISVSMGNGGL